MGVLNMEGLFRFLVEPGFSLVVGPEATDRSTCASTQMVRMRPVEG
jgi:hypothetical protein